MVLPLRVGVAAALGKHLGQQSQQEDAHQDGHVRYQHGGVGHVIPGPFHREGVVEEAGTTPYSLLPIPCFSSISG